VSLGCRGGSARAPEEKEKEEEEEEEEEEEVIRSCSDATARACIPGGAE